MADVRPFRALRYDASRVDPALVIAPPYDVISPVEQANLYGRSEHNIVRIEYGEERVGDSTGHNRYGRAATDLVAWRSSGVLMREEGLSVYAYAVRFEHDGRRYKRRHLFAVVRLEPWDRGIVRPHEYTLSGPKADRLELLRATRTQVSPVYCLYKGDAPQDADGEVVYDFEADGQHHRLTRIHAGAAARAVDGLRDRPLYIADGHHRYETALNYRDECRAASESWSGEEPENFVLMALTPADDTGLVVLPTHRVVNPPSFPDDALERLGRAFDMEEIPLDSASEALSNEPADVTSFAAVGLVEGAGHVLRLRDRAPVEAAMPAAQPESWRRLDVSVLQYGVLQAVFGIDEAVLAAGSAVTYTHDTIDAVAAARDGRARLAFLLRATPVEQTLAVADAGARMPQKSTYFFPKLPTGIVLYPLD